MKVINLLNNGFSAQTNSTSSSARLSCSTVSIHSSIHRSIAEGTKAYHNFTKDKHPDDMDAKRFIISFDCDDPWVDERTGLEWVLLSVLGAASTILLIASN